MAPTPALVLYDHVWYPRYCYIYIGVLLKWSSTVEGSGNMLINLPDALIVVRTFTIGPSGMLTMELAIYVVVPFSLDEIIVQSSLKVRVLLEKFPSARSRFEL